MPVLKNARHERFIQGVVKGISPGPAYTAAGYEVTGNSAESAAARLLSVRPGTLRFGWIG